MKNKKEVKTIYEDAEFVRLARLVDIAKDIQVIQEQAETEDEWERLRGYLSSRFDINLPQLK